MVVPASDIKTSEPAVPTTSGNGYYKPTNLKGGATVLRRVDQSMPHYFATVIRRSERPISGEKHPGAGAGGWWR